MAFGGTKVAKNLFLQPLRYNPIMSKLQIAKKGWAEVPKHSGIRVRKVQNRSGGACFGEAFKVEVPHRVTGRGRKRKQFNTYEAAEKFAFHEFRRYQKLGQDHASLFMDLSTAELFQLKTAWDEIGKHEDLSILEAVQFAIKRLRPHGGNKTFEEVCNELIESKELRLEKGYLREKTVRDFKFRCVRIGKKLGAIEITKLSCEAIVDWVQSQNLSARSNLNYLNTIGEILNYAIQRRYLSENPMTLLTQVDRKALVGNQEEKQPGILTVDEATRLLQAACDHPELDLLPSVILGLFCGLRTEEIKRLDWQYVKFTPPDGETPYVEIPSEIAKKRRLRIVDIPDNALAWLALCVDRDGLIAPNEHINQFQKFFKHLVRYAGIGHYTDHGKWVSGWKINAMRHSFGSYHYALHGSAEKTCSQMGHKQDDVLFTHYRALVYKRDAEQYFTIKPK